MMTKRQLAIHYIKQDIAIHDAWIEFIERNPTGAAELEPIKETAGDVSHHRRWRNRLRIVLRELEK